MLGWVAEMTRSREGGIEADAVVGYLEDEPVAVFKHAYTDLYSRRLGMLDRVTESLLCQAIQLLLHCGRKQDPAARSVDLHRQVVPGDYGIGLLAQGAD
jgi:hypothetical protein